MDFHGERVVPLNLDISSSVRPRPPERAAAKGLKILRLSEIAKTRIGFKSFNSLR
jgi:hypothetical protein